jgi:hypothetical protein
MSKISLSGDFLPQIFLHIQMLETVKKSFIPLKLLYFRETLIISLIFNMVPHQHI